MGIVATKSFAARVSLFSSNNFGPRSALQVIVIGLVVSCTTTWLPAQVHPAGEYQVARRTHPIVLDGVLSGAAEWSEAQFQSGKWFESGGLAQDQRSEFTSGFRLVWDPQPTTGGLYIWGQMNHRAPGVNGAGPVVLDGTLDAVNLYFDPNSDAESGFLAQSNAPDGYHVAFNITGPRLGATSGTQRYLQGGQTNTGNLPISVFGHINSLSGNQGNPSVSGDPAALSGSGWSVATFGTTSGWSFEMFMPWSTFDACVGGQNGNGDGLCLLLDTLEGRPAVGDKWFFNFGSIFQDGGRTHFPAYATYPGDNSESDFAAWPHPTIEFVDAFSGVAADLNGDGGVDGADAAILYSNWGNGNTGDLNQDFLVDGADLASLFSDWTGDSHADPHPNVPEPTWVAPWALLFMSRRRMSVVAIRRSRSR